MFKGALYRFLMNFTLICIFNCLRYATNEFLMINQNMCVNRLIINKIQSSQLDHALQKHPKIKNEKNRV